MQLFYFAIIITLRNKVSRRLSDDEIKFNRAQTRPSNYFSSQFNQFYPWHCLARVPAVRLMWMTIFLI